jgi:cell division transport system ATP-binding protein
MLEFNDVTKIYKDKPVLKNISFKVEAGDFLLLSGPSSSGKSTILRLTYMDTFPTKGFVKVMDFYSNKISGRQLPILRRKIGFISQEEKFLKNKTVFGNLDYVLKLTKKHDKNIIGEMLEKLGLNDRSNFYPFELSSSEHQKLKIAQALVKSPLLLLADEPLNNLDNREGEEILSLLKDINVEGATVVLATSRENVYQEYSTKRIYIENGEIKSSTL